MAEPGVVTSAGFTGQGGGGEDRSATGLQYQRYTLGLNATGAALGVGRRIAPDPEDLFTRNASSAQFGNGGNARASVGEGMDAEEAL